MTFLMRRIAGLPDTTHTDVHVVPFYDGAALVSFKAAKQVLIGLLTTDGRLQLLDPLFADGRQDDSGAAWPQAGVVAAVVSHATALDNVGSSCRLHYGVQAYPWVDAARSHHWPLTGPSRAEFDLLKAEVARLRELLERAGNTLAQAVP